MEEGDFNSHSVTWGAQQNNPRGTEIEHWAAARNLRKYIVKYTWRRVNHESTIDIVFTNTLTTFTKNPNRHLAYLDSDHSLLAGQVTTLMEGNPTYTTLDWDFFTDYVEKETPFSPIYFNSVYTELMKLLIKHSITKTCSRRSKKWWDEEISAQLHKVKRAPAGDYKEEAKSLKNMIRKKKKECGEKFLNQSGSRDPWGSLALQNTPWVLGSPYTICLTRRETS